MVIAGGTATLLVSIAGAALVIVMKGRRQRLHRTLEFCLGAIFVLIVVFMPEGLVPGLVRLWRGRDLAVAPSAGAARAAARG